MNHLLNHNNIITKNIHSYHWLKTMSWKGFALDVQSFNFATYSHHSKNIYIYTYTHIHRCKRNPHSQNTYNSHTAKTQTAATKSNKFSTLN